ncbi:hypothetical protein, partial [Thauera aromatica]|uniref:hypothetical protein n=1 Tax=Thauera aromatica TaxID=59405 RepID=UPI001FFC64C8
LPLARAIPGALDPPAASGKTGSMKPTLWKTKNRGKLSGQQQAAHSATVRIQPRTATHPENLASNLL